MKFGDIHRFEQYVYLKKPRGDESRDRESGQNLSYRLPERGGYPYLQYVREPITLSEFRVLCSLGRALARPE